MTASRLTLAEATPWPASAGRHNLRQRKAQRRARVSGRGLGRGAGSKEVKGGWQGGALYNTQGRAGRDGGKEPREG